MARARALISLAGLKVKNKKYFGSANSTGDCQIFPGTKMKGSELRTLASPPLTLLALHSLSAAPEIAA